MSLFFACVLGFVIPVGMQGASPPTPRPSIWATAADRAAILQKIETQAWARTQFEALRERSTERVVQHRADADAYLRSLPWIEAAGGGHPTFEPIAGDMASKGSARSAAQTILQAMLAHGIDCGVLHYVTGDPAYAAVGADVLQAIVQGLRGLKPSTSAPNGGWLYPDDHLYEARILGAQLPILYDLVADHLRKPGATVWDLATKRRVPFDFAAAQEVFRTYVRLAVEHGMQVSSNWPVLEMPSLAHNALALDDPAERAHWLAYVTHVDAPRQDPLEVIVHELREHGGVWPESFNYANDVAAKVTYVVALLQRQVPALKLPSDVGLVSRSMLRIREFRFPDGGLVRFGDGGRSSRLPMPELEMAYALAVREKNEGLMVEFGGLLRAALEDGSYDRARLGALPNGAQVYLAPLSLLWFEPEFAVSARAATPLPVTDVLPFAGLVMQRNLAPDADPVHGLMAAVHGASFIHGHASGMTLELFSSGHVLVTNAGKGTYRSDEHVNYRRLFAAYNGVIVNGASNTSGGWMNLGMDTVRPVVMEPAPRAAAVSSHHSFTITAFTDQQVGGSKADQERTVGIVRTSDVGGYYVDVYRSRGQGTGQFHDYVLHHVGDRVDWQASGEPVVMRPAPDRFQPAPGAGSAKSNAYAHPGWHFFKDAAVAMVSEGDFTADFHASGLGEAGVGSRLHLTAETGREYAGAFAPATVQAPGGYDKQLTPVAVIRQKGEAWNRPFAVVHQPYVGKASAEGVRGVKALRSDGAWQGLIVDGSSETGTFRHYILAPAPERASVRIDGLGLDFEGRYAWIAVDAAGEPVEIYVGQGTRLRHRGVGLRREDGKTFSAHAEKTVQGWRITSPDSGGISLSGAALVR